MFDSITLGPFGAPNAIIDAGLLAECLLFYRRVRVVAGSQTLKTLVRTCGADELLELCAMGCLEITFLENMTAITTVETNVGACHDLTTISSPVMTFSRTARVIADEEGGISSRKVKRIFDGFMKTVKRSEYDREILSGAGEALHNRKYLEGAVRRSLSYLVPEYTVPNDLFFRPQDVPKIGIRYDTNIDFAAANALYRSRPESADSSLTPALLLAHITTAEADIVIASRNDSEFALDPLKSLIVSSRMAEILEKSTAGKEKLEGFQEIVVDDSRSIREAVNSGERTFKDLIHLVDKAQKFKDWLHKTGEDSLLRDDYLKSISVTDWADNLPPKSLRFMIMNGLGIVAGLTLDPVTGIAVGLGLNAADSFLLDRLLKGWKPNHFIEGTLRPFLKK